MTHCELELISSWVGRALITCVYLITVYIFGKENYGRKQHNQHKQKLIKSSKAMQYWSTTSFISCQLSSILLLMTTILPICSHILVVSYGAVLFIIVTLTFYQIARLQYVFSDVAHGYGYHPLVFVVLYTVGCVIVIYMILIVIHYYLHSTVKTNPYICVNIVGFDIKFLATYLGLFLLWDWSVLIAYIVKIYQLSHNHPSEHNETVTKIKTVLQKIVVLTLLLECFQFCVFVYFMLHMKGFLSIIVVYHVEGTKIGPSLEILLALFAMYLMIDHNHDKYLKLVRCLQKIKLCCGCRCGLLSDENMLDDKTDLRDDAVSMGPSTSVTNTNDKNITISPSYVQNRGPETKSLNNEDEKHEEEDIESQRTNTEDLERYREINMRVLNSICV
eukprot:105203_1